MGVYKQAGSAWPKINCLNCLGNTCIHKNYSLTQQAFKQIHLSLWYRNKQPIWVVTNNSSHVGFFYITEDNTTF